MMLARISEALSRSIVVMAMIMVLLLFMLLSPQSRAEVYKTNSAFLSEQFGAQVPAVKTIWIKGGLKKSVADILAHPYSKLRVKYWMMGNKSVWILEEIGKEKPITSGIVITNGKISKVEILAFRESRGWEVKYPFFLKQFLHVGLKGNSQLDRHIDGITGATLSVRAVTKLSRMALLLHNHVASK